MSLSWIQRKARLASLLKSQGDEDADGLALDRILHGQNVIGKTSKTSEIDTLRFHDRDLNVVGTLEYGQFGVIDVVNCRLDGRVYVRKTIEKRFALRTRDQCSPQFERDILLQALKTDSHWAPHLLCAFQSPTHLSLVMDYAEGGTLWDVLESSPHDGKILESDLRWWAPQIVSAIHWCHCQGFAHRDIKPHNFVLTPDAHVLLIDFGSAAPLLPPGPDGSQLLPKKHCLVPCGTCDYISPEILKAHEEALVAMEMEDGDTLQRSNAALGSNGYGRETDWWSLGAMLYEMVYGFAPFFAKDIRQTYIRIIDHEKRLRFDETFPVSRECQHFLRGLLTRAEDRLGRRHINEITNHSIFNEVDWDALPTQAAPPALHLPQFTYTEPAVPANAQPAVATTYDESYSQAFAFSALFQSSRGSSPLSGTPANSSHHATPSPREDTLSAFIGFSWGPLKDAFPNQEVGNTQSSQYLSPTVGMDTPRPMRIPSTRLNTPNSLLVPRGGTLSTPHIRSYPFSTPNRPSSLTTYQTLPRTSTVRRTVARRSVSDREAMRQLVDCVGMSARKKVLESGRKPRLLTSLSRSGTVKKELRFLPPLSIPVLDPSARTKPPPILINHAYSGSEDTESEGPPSPSPSPRPGSAMSIMSRRSEHTLTGTFSQRTGLNTASSNSTMFLNLPTGGSGGGGRSRSNSVGSSVGAFSFGQTTLDELEEKHSSLLGDILDIEARLVRISRLVR